MTTTHDELAYAVAVESIAAIRANQSPWDTVFSADCHITSSRQWPVPDFVLQDDINDITAAAEFKPPGQSKREYLTGLGQAVAYTRDFDYGILVVPDLSDDGYRIAAHIKDILQLNEYTNIPIALLRYDPSSISATAAQSSVEHFFQPRASSPPNKASVESSFYAKWRDISPQEMAQFLRYLYEEKLYPTHQSGTIRDRAWEKLWDEIQLGNLQNWSNTVRTIRNDSKNKVAWMKNYRNFVNHAGWMETDGSLTEKGFQALHITNIYGYDSTMFLDFISNSILIDGKHLILINAINEYQDRYLSNTGSFRDEQAWLDGIETHLEDTGLLKRNPGRHNAAVQGSQRQFLKAEKTLWRNLRLIIPRQRRVFHPNRGFIFNWSRITELLRKE